MYQRAGGEMSAQGGQKIKKSISKAARLLDRRE